jgi:hypothetical protein
MRRHAVVWVVLASVVAIASADAESDYWREWRTRPEHGDEGRGPWHFTNYVKIEPVGPAVAGQPVTVRTRARFRQGHAPPARVKARVFWSPGLRTELLSDELVETYIGPKDTLDVTAVLRSNDGALSAEVLVYLHYVVGGVPVMDPRRFASAPRDYWWFAGRGVINLGPNPLSPAELLNRDQLDRIYQDIQQAFMDRLAGARVGTVAASEGAQAVIDSLLPMVDEPTRRQLGVACDYLGGRTKTAPRDAALFVGKQVHVWAKGPEYGCGTPQKAAEWAVGQAEHGLLLGMYEHVVETLASPWIQTWQPLHDAKDGKITWDEARRRVDEHIKAHPDDPEVQKDGPTVRDVILPEWRAKYERPWWKKWLDRLKGERKSEGEAPPDDERYTYSFHGYWKYHDHAVTRYDGLAPETTSETVQRACVSPSRVDLSGGCDPTGRQVALDSASEWASVLARGR